MTTAAVTTLTVLTKADLETLYGCGGDTAKHAGDAGYADDDAPAAGHHDARDVLDPGEDAAQVDRHDDVEVGEVDGGGGSSGKDDNSSSREQLAVVNGSRGVEDDYGYCDGGSDDRDDDEDSLPVI
uniref:Uncharacterized protein n=1 Tax=Oryza brachyantha TaxID=4533 RepID=J3M6S2_ORYBR